METAAEVAWDSVTGQTVVETATVNVVSAVEWAGQLVTVGAQLMIVETCVVKIVLVVKRLGLGLTTADETLETAEEETIGVVASVVAEVVATLVSKLFVVPLLEVYTGVVVAFEAEDSIFEEVSGLLFVALVSALEAGFVGEVSGFEDVSAFEVVFADDADVVATLVALVKELVAGFVLE